MTADYDTTETSEVPAELRKHAKRLEAENKALRAEVLEGHLEKIGLSPNAGLGKAIAKEYNGEFTAEAVAQYASDEYEYTPTTTETSTAAAEDTTVEVPVSDTEAAQATFESVENRSAPVTPEPDVDPIEQADARLMDPDSTRRDAMTAISAKVRAYNEQFNR